MKKDLYEQFVSQLREQYQSLSLSEITKDIEEAIEEFGIKVKYSDMSDIKTNEEISGYIHTVDGKPEIVVNGLQHKKRQRFTIAHELGHALLHWEWFPGKTLPSGLVEVSYRKENYQDEEDKKKELEANNFAAEFLAPKSEVSKYLKEIEEQYPNKELQISSISNKFNISIPAAYYRWSEVME